MVWCLGLVSETMYPLTRLLFKRRMYGLGWWCENTVRRWCGGFIVPSYHFGCPHCEGR